MAFSVKQNSYNDQSGRPLVLLDWYLFAWLEIKDYRHHSQYQPEQGSVGFRLLRLFPKVHFDFERASSRVRFPAALLRSCSFFSSRAGESTHMHMVSSVSVNDFSSMIFLRVSSGKWKRAQNIPCVRVTSLWTPSFKDSLFFFRSFSLFFEQIL